VDFIEKYFGISPDGGDGSLEIMLLMLLVVGACDQPRDREGTRPHCAASVARPRRRGDRIGDVMSCPVSV